MQNGPPTEPQYCSISALPPKSLTTAQPSGGVSVSPNPTERIFNGQKPSHDDSLYESQIGLPGRQNCDAGLLNGDVWPISHTNAFGVSLTMPQFSELPSSFVSNTGTIGPSGLFNTTVPVAFVFSSVTSTCHPSPGLPRWKCRSIVSPACMTRGECFVPVVSIALNSAGSWNTGFCPVARIDHTGVQTVYAFGT